MQGVEFENQEGEDEEFHIRSRKLFGAPETPTMVKLLLKSKIVKNEKQALLFLICVVILFAALSFLIYWFVNNRIENKIVDQNGNILTIQEYLINLKKAPIKSAP